MFTGSLESIAAATGGVVFQGHPTLPVRGVFTDTREPVPGGLFVALRGERYDGHRFVGPARQAGAAAVMISRMDALKALDGDAGCGAVLAPNTRQAYLALGAAHRLKLDHVRWFAVTASAGKTSVKEMLAQILSCGAGWKVHRAPRSFNNEIGVPATILAADPTHRAVVLELGTNHPGEIALLAGVARPHVAILGNAGPVHLEAFGSVAGVAEEKSHILDCQGPGDVAVLNADDPCYDLWAGRSKGRIVSFGCGPSGDVRGEALEERPGRGAHFIMCTGSRAVEVQLAVPGPHNVRNALAAAAAALGAHVSLEAVVAGLTAYRGMKRRFEVLEANGVRIIDDAFNANPLSFHAALVALKTFAGRRLFVVAGDMLELGEQAEKLHEELGRWLARIAPQAVLTVGGLAARAGEAAVREGLTSSAWASCGTPEEAAERLRPHLAPGDVVLVKGSHAMQMERCVALLAERPALSAAG